MSIFVGHVYNFPPTLCEFMGFLAGVIIKTEEVVCLALGWGGGGCCTRSLWVCPVTGAHLRPTRDRAGQGRVAGASSGWWAGECYTVC